MSHEGRERFANTFLCEVHDKVTHRSRWAAKRAGRLMHDKGFREYRCSAHPGHWHTGHIPPWVRRGLYTIDEWFALPYRVRREHWRELDARVSGHEPGRSGPAEGKVAGLGGDPGEPGREDRHEPVGGLPDPAGQIPRLEDLDHREAG